MFELTLENAAAYLVERGVVTRGTSLEAVELPGGVSATVIAAHAPTTGEAFVVKQALPQLRVSDEWLATPDRAETEVAAMEIGRAHV